jgi:hypothetical protein
MILGVIRRKASGNRTSCKILLVKQRRDLKPDEVREMPINQRSSDGKLRAIPTVAARMKVGR